MGKEKIIIICLDAFDIKLSDRLIAEGRLKGLAKCRDQSARFSLEHGPNNYSRNTGLTGEHIATGLSPETTGRWAPIFFDSNDYTAYQKFTQEIPYLAKLDANCVVVDPTYFDLESSENCVGIVGWSGHDPGVNEFSRPASLRSEIDEKFGAPVDTDLINSTVYPNPELTKQFGKAVVDITRKRTAMAKWMLGERFANEWDVALISFSEGHDAIEQLYFGVDKDHRLAGLETAPLAEEILIETYEAISDGIAELMDAHPDAAFLVFSMHGMGENQTDIPSMLLLPELLYRHSFGRPLFRSREDWLASPEAPLLKDGELWTEAVVSAMRHPQYYRVQRGLKKIARKLGLYEAGPAEQLSHRSKFADDEFPIDWVPGYRYREFWPHMRAFALPSMFDGRVRINLKGRERFGQVELKDYESEVEAIELLLRSCVNPETGESIVEEIKTPGIDNPLSLSESEGDLHVLWNKSLVTFEHPNLGLMGPAPVRRAGGHTGRYGRLYLRKEGVEPGEYDELRSSFDIAPTVVEILGQKRPNRLDGKSVLDKVLQSVS